MSKILVVLLFVAVANAAVLFSDTPAYAAEMMDKHSRSNYERVRKNYRGISLSYDEALVVAPDMMYQLARANYEADRKSYTVPTLSFDEALALARSGWKCR